MESGTLLSKIIFTLTQETIIFYPIVKKLNLKNYHA